MLSARVVLLPSSKQSGEHLFLANDSGTAGHHSAKHSIQLFVAHEDSSLSPSACFLCDTFTYLDNLMRHFDLPLT